MDTGYLPFYFQGYRILSILLPGILDTLFNFRDTVFLPKNKKKLKKPRKNNSKSPFERRELKKKTFIRKIFWPSQPYCFDCEFLQTARRRLSEMFREITACIYRKGVEKAVVKWSFTSNIPSIQKDQPEPSLKTFICELNTKHGLSSRCQYLGINTY